MERVPGVFRTGRQVEQGELDGPWWDPALDVDTEEEFDRSLNSGVWVIAPTTADAESWHPWDEDNTNSLEDVLATDDDPDPTQEDASDPPGWFIRRLGAW